MELKSLGKSSHSPVLFIEFIKNRLNWSLGVVKIKEFEDSRNLKNGIKDFRKLSDRERKLWSI